MANDHCYGTRLLEQMVVYRERCASDGRRKAVGDQLYQQHLQTYTNYTMHINSQIFVHRFITLPHLSRANTVKTTQESTSIIPAQTRPLELEHRCTHRHRDPSTHRTKPCKRHSTTLSTTQQPPTQPLTFLHRH